MKLLEQSRTHMQTRIFAVVLSAALACAAFGPYIVGGVRVEQAVVYLAFAILVPLNFRHLYRDGTYGYLLVWGSYLVTALIGLVLYRPPANARWDAGSTIAGMDNLLLPIAVMLVVWTSVPRVYAADTFRIVAQVLSVAMAANGFITIISTFFDISPLLRIFWAPAGDVFTVGQNSVGNGRYSGLFNQPSEAGLLYGVAGLLAIFAWRHRQVLLAVLVSFIFIGGMLTVSKVFLLGGLPLIVVYWFILRPRGTRPTVAFLCTFAVLLVIPIIVLQQWRGFAYLARLLPTAGIFDRIFASRYGDDAGIMNVIRELLSESPVYGVGVSGWNVPYDSGWVQALVLAGIIGFVAFAMIFVLMGITAMKLPRNGLRSFGVLLTLLLVGASIAIPPLSANRVATIVWLLISLLVLISEQGAKIFDFKARAQGLKSRAKAEDPSQISTSEIGAS